MGVNKIGIVLSDFRSIPIISAIDILRSIKDEKNIFLITSIRNIEKKIGWMAELSRKWGVCPRSGLMFIKRWYADYQPRKK